MVVDYLAGGGLSIFQKGGILGQSDHPALEQHLTCERLFQNVQRPSYLRPFQMRMMLVQVYGNKAPVVNSKLRINEEKYSKKAGFLIICQVRCNKKHKRKKHQKIS